MTAPRPTSTDTSGTRATDLDVWSDFVCGHCYYGTRRIVAALALLPDPDAFRLRWRSFQLDPRPAGARPSGDLYDYLAQFNGSRAAGRAAMDRIGAVAAADGLPFRPDRARPGNTTDAHRLVHLARREGRDTETVLSLYTAYWTEGRPIADRTVLRELAADVGLDARRAQEVLDGDEFTAEVAEDQQRAAHLGVMGVPALVVGDRWSLGATATAEAIAAELHLLSRERNEA
ncbi:DsbA family oxidoreductase [Streptomyces sp. NBC_00878]|uniref:DsbA family oxidoreductase n=1 Tax=Streptomyces sp. NBC_00878 TaxID=2975854 RepID=UPI0022508088|nr:DsbA family oxidoreductase [Streptomyces sp. NBC_00878]MCX4906888.1 DsbA family oxidoreductase [Streptomyces sp. NBC_00878]